MKQIIENLLTELNEEYEKLKSTRGLIEYGKHSERLMDLESDIYHSIFHLKRVLKNLKPNELRAVNRNEAAREVCPNCFESQEPNTYTVRVCSKCYTDY